MLALMLLCKTAVAQGSDSRSYIYDANHRLIAATGTYGACRAAIFQL
jgi:hypothetical protein